MPPEIAPYGSWRSPITLEMAAESAGWLSSYHPVFDDGELCLSESRPSEGGRTVIMRREAGRFVDVTPPGYNVRTRVHEYGGGAWAVDGGTVYFSNFADQRLYRQDAGATPRPITPEADHRYADGVIDRRQNRMVCVREDHTTPGEVVNTIVSVDLAGEAAQAVLVAGNDFYSSPRLSPDGGRLLWLTWNHPNMPFDGTELWTGRLDGDGSIVDREKLAGGRDEAIVQPEWGTEGAIIFVSDRSGWWNLYQHRAGETVHLAPMDAEFALPPWVMGMGCYSLDGDRIAAAYCERGTWRLMTIDRGSGAVQRYDLPYTELINPCWMDGRVVATVASAAEPGHVIAFDPGSGAVEVLHRAARTAIDPGYLSTPEAIEFPTERGLTAHAFYYPPRNKDCWGPAGELPPLLVRSHGGPTAAATASLDIEYQYWTSRGFAIVDVNYGGSTGYGREYRRRLDGQWGIVDVDDCVNAARYLVSRGLVDERRLAIDGGSAGGYTTLSALAFRDVFKAGASYYGVSDVEALATDTHKFEARYLDGLIGPYPERRDVYVERSPIHHVDRLSCPMIFLQGLEDEVVPPDQSERMFDAVRAKGLPAAYVTFEGEQHGFRQAKNIRRALEAEFYFYSRVFGFEPVDTIEPVVIENL